MRVLRCLLSGLLGAIIALIAILISLIVCLSVISARNVRSARFHRLGSYLYGPKLTGNRAAVILVLVTIVGLGFTLGYRLQSRWIRRRAVAENSI